MLGPWAHFLELSPISLSSRAPSRHTLPSTGWLGCGPRSQALEQGCLGWARCWRKHPPKRFSIWLCTTCEASWAGDRGQIIWLFSDSTRIKSSLDVYLPANIRPSMTWNPPNAEYNKWKLFSIILTGAFSFPSLGAFFPWLKAYPAEQVAAAYTAPDICCEDTASLSLQATAANQGEFELGMISLQIPVMESQALEGIRECAELRPLIQQVPGQKAVWKPVHCTLSLSDTYSFLVFSTFIIYLPLQWASR